MSMKHIEAIAPLLALVLTACGGGAAPAAGTPPNAAVTSTAAPASAAPATAPGPTTGTSTTVACTGAVSDAFVASRFGLAVTPAIGAALPAGAPQLASGLQQHTCVWTVPGFGALSAVGGKISIVYGSFPDAATVRGELDKLAAESKDSEPVSGVGDKAYQGPVSSKAALWVMAASGTKYVMATMVTGEPDLSRYQEPMRDLARETLSKS
jgi:hypothetical protein